MLLYLLPYVTTYLHRQFNNNQTKFLLSSGHIMNIPGATAIGVLWAAAVFPATHNVS